MSVRHEGAVVIAEIGVNHNGSLQLAKELVNHCAEAGADYAKFQTFSATKLATRAAQVAPYQQESDAGERQVNLLSPLELSYADFDQLVSHCDSQGIGFLTTAHDMVSAKFVLDLKSDYIKVASGDVTNYPFLQLVAQENGHVLLSTGASRAGEVQAAVEALEDNGLRRSQVTVMQCTTEYPAPEQEANLRAMLAMGEDLGTAIGFSDHTAGKTIALAAVALGATVLEKHITLDRTMDGPDHAASLEPSEFAELVASIRRVEASLGAREKVVTESEDKNRDLIRKSVVALRPIKAGDVFSTENIGVMRPGTGTSPMVWPDLIGRVSPRSYLPEEMIDFP